MKTFSVSSLLFLIVAITFVEAAKGNSLKCQVNKKGNEPKEETCTPPNDKYCNYIEKEGAVERNCSAGKGSDPKVKCIKTSSFTSCLCKGDNCNAKYLG